MADSRYRAACSHWLRAIDEYGRITLMNKGSDSRFSRPPMLLLYSKHGMNHWHNVKQNLVPRNNGQMQLRDSKGRTRSLPLTRKALIHQMAAMKKTAYRQILILTRSPMTRGLDMCLQKRIHPTGGIRGRKCSAYWNSKIYLSLLHPIFQVGKVPIPY